MPISSLFKSYDPYEGAVPDPNTGLSQPTQLRLPGLFLTSHVAVRGGIVGTLFGLGLGVVVGSGVYCDRHGDRKALK